MTLAAARQALADALSTVPEVTVLARPDGRDPAKLTGYVIVTPGAKIVSADYAAASVPLTALVFLSADQALAEHLLDEVAIPLLDAVTRCDLPTADVGVAPELVLAGTNQAPYYAATVTLTTEV